MNTFVDDYIIRRDMTQPVPEGCQIEHECANECVHEKQRKQDGELQRNTEFFLSNANRIG